MAFDVPRLGNPHELRGVHVQCDVGTDTLWLYGLGARTTGLVSSGPSVPPS